jgi:hypothetical protein
MDIVERPAAASWHQMINMLITYAHLHARIIILKIGQYKKGFGMKAALNTLCL